MESINKTIFDLGLHEGDDTSYYLKNNYDVVAVEANPVLVKHCEKKFSAYINNKSLTIINKCISDTESDSVTFWINENNSEWSAFDEITAKKNNTTAYSIKIEALTTSQLFEKYGVPYYLKIDIEESDIHVLDAIESENKPRYVSCEVGNPLLLDILKDKGYTKFKMINQATGFNSFSYWEEYLYIPSLLRKIYWRTKKKFFPSSIPYGDSGPFGEETRGEWKSYEAVKKDFLNYYPSENNPINKLSWYDFHATY